MNTADILISLRYKLPRETYSEYQIVDGLNYVINEISLALNSITSSLLTTSAILTLEDNEANLPSDLESIIKVKDRICIPFTDDIDAYTYQIIGNTIRAEGETVTVYYKKTLPTYSYNGAITPTTIDLPVSFENLIKDNIVAFVTGQPLNIMQDAIKLASTRDGKKRPQNLIFRL
jgi:hypothetical protein